MNSFTRTLNLAIPIAYALGSLLGIFFYALLVQAMLWLGIPQSLVEALGGGLAFLFTIAISYKLASGQISGDSEAMLLLWSSLLILPLSLIFWVARWKRVTSIKA
jgi:uncharacterized membrane-anchored protein